MINTYEIKYPVFVLSMEEHDIIKNHLLKLIEEEKNHLINDKEQNVLTDWKNNEGKERKYFNYVKPHFDKYIKKVIPKLKPSPINIYYDNFWFQQYYKDFFHDWHNHGSSWGVVYFLELPNKSMSTEFYTPLVENHNIQFEIKEGDIVIFPAHIFHKSAKNPTDERKTIIATNLIVS